MKKICELCSKPARMYCDSDQASLCWDCDERVHCANFLVAKHSRNLLCHVCQSPTPWKASGTRLSPTLSVCESCFNRSNGEVGPRRRRGQEDEEIESGVGDEDCEEYSGSEAEIDEDHLSDSDREFDDDDDDSAEEEEEDGENQVVPWSSSPAAPPSSAPPASTTSSSEYGSFSTRDGGGGAVTSAFMRLRRDMSPHLDSDEEDDGCCTSQVNSEIAAMEENGVLMRAVKMARTDAFSHVQLERENQSRAMGEGDETEFRTIRSPEVLSSFMRFQQRKVCGDQHNASEIIQGISKLSSRDHLNTDY